MASDPHNQPLAGAIGSYIHAGGKIGVLVELGCESDRVSRTEEFNELLHDVAMQIAASEPKFIRKDEVTDEALLFSGRFVACGRESRHTSEARRETESTHAGITSVRVAFE